MTLGRIISGGQTGADQGGLWAARSLGVPTGGWAPRGFRTEVGAATWLGTAFGLVEHDSAAYPPRTRANVLGSNATVVFGSDASPGCRLTLRLAHGAGRPVCCILLGDTLPRDLQPAIRQLDVFLAEHRPSVLNVAGRRESSVPGIGVMVHLVVAAAAWGHLRA